MTLAISIPKEFEEHYSMDHFVGSLKRIEADIKLEEKCFCGTYEVKFIEMLKNAFRNATEMKDCENCKCKQCEIKGNSKEVKVKDTTMVCEEWKLSNEYRICETGYRYVRRY